MHILAIMGSPRRESNTELLLDATLRGAAECGATADKIVICEMNINPCVECYACAVDGTCPIPDDMSLIYDQLVSADCVLLASPIFFYGLTAQAKALVDRCQALWVRRYMLKCWQPDVASRKGALIAVGATRGARLFDGVLLTAKYFFDAVGVQFADQLLVKGMEERAQVIDQPGQIDEAVELGRRLACP